MWINNILLFDSNCILLDKAVLLCFKYMFEDRYGKYVLSSSFTQQILKWVVPIICKCLVKLLCYDNIYLRLSYFILLLRWFWNIGITRLNWQMLLSAQTTIEWLLDFVPLDWKSNRRECHLIILGLQNLPWGRYIRKQHEWTLEAIY